MTDRFFDLSFTIQPDNSVHLVQHDGCENCTIVAHPQQLAFIANKLTGQQAPTSGPVDDLRRRIAVLTDKLQDIVCCKHFRSDLLGSGDGFAYLARLDALLDLALEYDGGRLIPDSPMDRDEGDSSPDQNRISNSAGSAALVGV